MQGAWNAAAAGPTLRAKGGAREIIRGGALGPYPAAAAALALYKGWIRVHDLGFINARE